MSRRQVLEALSGLLLGMFVSMIAGTVVSTSLPVIVHDLGGDQTAFTWVITATLLTTAISTPIWGKLADLFNRKLLIQIALVLFVVASAVAGFSESASALIAARAVQGIGAGGLAALSQIIMADIISPRERGRYAGLFGAVMALATVGGPLLGGLITDTLGWRWNFFVAVPFAIAALIMLQLTLHLPRLPQRRVRIDYFGIVLLSVSVSLLLIWVTMGGSQFEWDSLTSILMGGGAGVGIIAFVIVEIFVKEPLVPMSLFRNRTFTLSVIASIATGLAMFGMSVYLSQYMQMSRGASPTEAGLMTLPMIGGLLISSIVVGQLISRFGKFKIYMVVGSIMLLAGSFLLTTIHYDTNFGLLSLYMFLAGAGVGMTMQNLVLVVQNTAKPSEMGVASSGVAFFRSVGGTVGVSVMGAMLASKLLELFGTNAAALKKAAAAAGTKGREALEGLSTGTIPEVRLLPAGIREIVEDSYAQAIAFSFWIAVPLALIALIAIIVLPNVPLGHLTTSERLAEDEASLAAVSGNVSTATGSIYLPDVADTAAATTTEPTEPQVHPATDAHAAGRSARSSS
ncbi:MFS transporter [Microbacterium sp. NC79]|nr:MFS transporter [Microbacterium sp. NC79]